MSHEFKIAIVIPARAGSLGVLKKNMQKVRGKELVLRAIQHAKYLSNLIGGVVVLSTDSEEVISVALSELGFISATKNENVDFVVFDDFILHFRPKFLATSESLIMETLGEVREGLLQLDYVFDKWCLMQPTSPFRSMGAMVEVARLLSEGEIQNFSAISLTKVIDMHPARMYKVQGLRAFPLQGYEDHYFDRRQDLPPVYIRDGAYYLLSDDLVSSGIQYSTNPSFLIQEHPWNINIDTQEDLQLARMVEPQLFLDDPNS